MVNLLKATNFEAWLKFCCSGGSAREWSTLREPAIAALYRFEPEELVRSAVSSSRLAARLEGTNCQNWIKLFRLQTAITIHALTDLFRRMPRLDPRGSSFTRESIWFEHLLYEVSSDRLAEIFNSVALLKNGYLAKAALALIETLAVSNAHHLHDELAGAKKSVFRLVDIEPSELFGFYDVNGEHYQNDEEVNEYRWTRADLKSNLVAFFASGYWLQHYGAGSSSSVTDEDFREMLGDEDARPFLTGGILAEAFERLLPLGDDSDVELFASILSADGARREELWSNFFYCAALHYVPTASQQTVLKILERTSMPESLKLEDPDFINEAISSVEADPDNLYRWTIAELFLKIGPIDYLWQVRQCGTILGFAGRKNQRGYQMIQEVFRNRRNEEQDRLTELSAFRPI